MIRTNHFPLSDREEIPTMYGEARENGSYTDLNAVDSRIAAGYTRTMSTGTQRRLAAIVSADVVGYSRLMGEDEDGTMAALRRHRAELIDPKIIEHGGRIVKTMGDGLLLEFPSVVNATKCVIEIQHGMVQRNEGIDETRRIVFRVGINLGDIIIEGEDIFGDGVNVAARLQEISAPGGAIISQRVHDDVRDRLDVVFEDVGEQSLKNINRPVRVWRWPKKDQASVGDEDSLPAVASDLTPLETPSLAILPFRMLSDDAEHEFLADGLVEELNTMLGQISGLTVISRASTTRYHESKLDTKEIARALGARYILQGSLLARGARVRLNAQLIDGATREQLWGERYDNKIDDVFDLQDHLSREIVTALRLRLTDGEQARIWLRSTDNYAAWRAAMQGADLVWQGTSTSMARGRELFEQAIREDPEYAAAYGYLGFTHYFDLRFGFAGNPEETRLAMVANADKALELDSKNNYGLLVKAAALTFDNRFDEAITYMKASIASNPNDAVGRLNAARVLVNADRSAEGEREIRMAMRLNPHYPVNYLSVLANALTDLERYAEASTVLTDLISRNQDYIAGHLQRVYLESLLGNPNEARHAVAEVLRIDPDYAIAKAANYYISINANRKEAFLNSLRANGIPE